MNREKIFQGATAEEKAKYALKVMKARVDFKGYDYLINALIIAANNKGSVNDITKEIYDKIAEKVSKKRNSVVVAITYLIQNICDSGELENINKYIGHKIYKNNIKPTNADLIARISDKIRSELN